MAEIERDASRIFRKPFRKLLAALVFSFLVALFLLWRIQGERAEAMRARIVDLLRPTIEFGTQPGDAIYDLAAGIQTVFSANERIKQLENEVKSMREWRDYARGLERENASLRNIASVLSQPSFPGFTAEVLADTANHFARSVLINAGAENRIANGSPATDGLGLAGRVSGVGDSVSRVILLTDPSSRIPVKIEPSGSGALAIGDSSPAPLITMVRDAESVSLGDRVVTSGDGGVFPRNLLVGYVAQGPDKRLRVNLAANYRKLEFLAILQVEPPEPVSESDGLIVSEKGGLTSPSPN